MSGWRRTLDLLGTALEGGLARARDVALEATHEAIAGRARRTPRIVPYREFGTDRALVAAGRVLLDPPLPPAGDADSAWRNLVASYRRFESDEVPGARVRLSYGGDVRVVTTDGEGHFRATLTPTSPAPDDRSWHEVRAELLPTAADDTGDVAMLPVLVPSRHAAFGIISDIDDTVVRTDATQLLRMLRTVFLGNARTRLPFPGVAAFYRALRRGPAGDETNPLFYVSGGPWNLYELLVEFFAHQGIPMGPLLLRDWGVTSADVLPTNHVTHKRAAIRRVLETYPTLPFVLVGDSGQDDPEIYASVIREHPGRVHAAYIRDVGGDETRRGAVRALAAELARDGATLLLADDTLAAARHAAEQGWIDAAALAEVEAEVKKDGGIG